MPNVLITDLNGSTNYYRTNFYRMNNYPMNNYPMINYRKPFLRPFMESHKTLNYYRI